MTMRLTDALYALRGIQHGLKIDCVPQSLASMETQTQMCTSNAITTVVYVYDQYHEPNNASFVLPSSPGQRWMIASYVLSWKLSRKPSLRILFERSAAHVIQ